jgi:hypothetical protein
MGSHDKPGDARGMLPIEKALRDIDLLTLTAKL